MVHSGRRRGKGRSRILYWFRTPPGVRVGRAALDEDAIRLIEEHNPQIQFDWTRILKGQPEPPEPDERPERQARPRPAPASAAPPAPVVPPSTPTDIRPELGEEDDQEEKDEKDEQEDGQDEEHERHEADGVEPLAERPPSAAQARLGSEGLLRLRGRYAEISAAIRDRIQDQARRDELTGQAERLNPDTWVTEDEVKLGLEQYEAVFESLRAVVGRRRKRRRRRPNNPL